MTDKNHTDSSGVKRRLHQSERLQKYIEGESYLSVPQGFKAAVDIIGEKEIDLLSMSVTERKALNQTDLRWEMGPDGVLMWVERAYTRGERELANFKWLTDGAKQKWMAVKKHQNNIGNPEVHDCPSWLELWAETWASWAFRYTSVLFDGFLKNPTPKGKRCSNKYAYSLVNARLPSIHLLMLDYLPRCRLASALGRWPLPDELLDPHNNDENSNLLRDEFWNISCVPFATEESGYGKIKIVNKPGARHSIEVQLFLDFVAEKLNLTSSGVTSEELLKKYRCPFLPRTKNASLLILDDKSQYAHPLPRESDRTFSWIKRDYPNLSAWQNFACEYLQRGRNVTASLSAISIFVGGFLATAGIKDKVGEGLALEVADHPLDFLSRENRKLVPNCLHSIAESPKTQIRIYDFLEFILLRHCTHMDEGGLVRLETHANPFSAPERNRNRRIAFETARIAMPYEWIRRLRGIIVEGPNFCDWKWAQQAMKNPNGHNVDWFPVPPELIDEGDPDCVWRERYTGKDSTLNRIVEIWSPVRWVALVTKLVTALRTSQVRMLDSGEADHLRFDLHAWARASSPGPDRLHDMWTEQNLIDRNPRLAGSVQMLAEVRKGNKRNAARWNNGVLRPVQTNTRDGMRKETVLYINTNKTADNLKHGSAKGFEAAMPVLDCPLRLDAAGNWEEPKFSDSYARRIWMEDLGSNIHWWLAKLRDWQEKYNTVTRLVEWVELSGRAIISEKSDEQFASYVPACFLFREPARSTRTASGGLYPLTDGVMQNVWWALSKELQLRFRNEGKRNLNGSEIQLVLDFVGHKSRVCTFDLHSIRVSLITALVVDGKVPIEIVQRLVGHSRVIMTLFYTKINSLNMQKALAEGMRRLNETSARAEGLYLQNATAEQMRSYAAYHDEASAFAAIGISMEPEQRNAASWTRVVGGYCPVGAVASNTESGLPAGCFNGGRLTGSKKVSTSQSDYGPVTGGERACANCRWFVTTPAHLPELMSMFEVTQYRVYEQDERALVQAKELETAIKIEDKAHAENCDEKKMADLRENIERLEDQADTIAEQGIALKVTLGNTYRIIQRSLDILNSRDEVDGGQALVMVGGMQELGVILEETTSELLQLARISLHAEIFPELDPGKAILKCSEIMARKIGSDGLDPFLILDLSEQQRCQVTNAVLNSLSRKLEPMNDDLGLRAAVKVVEGPHTIASVLGIRPSAMQAFIENCKSQSLKPMRLGVVGTPQTKHLPHTS